MAEFSEVVKQYIRMCRLSTCEKCVLHGPPCWVRAKENPEEFELCIMEWAKKHSEPVYPTWYDWLKEQGILYHPDPSTINDKGFKPIPAEIAKKLGIEPIIRREQ